MLYPTNIIPIHQVICVNLAIMPGLSTPPKVTALKHGWTPWDSHDWPNGCVCLKMTTNIQQHPPTCGCLNGGKDD